jgi:hypothetical protein
MPCMTCDDTGWVCDAHPRRPWVGFSEREDACECGASGALCDCIDEVIWGDVDDLVEAIPKAAALLCAAAVARKRAVH